jgi:N6-adenosine-specific RNA methylase IME4
VRAWDFTPKSEIVWVKTTQDPVLIGPSRIEDGLLPAGRLHFGMGRYVRASHETCIIAARGTAIPLVQSHDMRSVFFAKVGAHSEKPEQFFEIVERLCSGPRLELFARRKRPGWTTVGDELSPLR